MIFKSQHIRYFVCLGLFFLLSCKKSEQILPQGVEQPFVVPSHFPLPHYSFANNPISSEGVKLGRRLFYDKSLSIDNSISCASCHHQQAAFSDPGKPVSLGVENRPGRRNSPPMFNLAWNTSFMWDGGINHIEVMPIAPITVMEEMDISLQQLIDRLNQNSFYVNEFEKVFRSTPITDKQLLYALTQFMTTLVSATSKYDKEIYSLASYTAQELQGKALFETNCANCHQPPLFTDFSFKNNGISTTEVDLGRYEISLDSNDIGKFKVPSLRNIALTYPYMHDGRIEFLEDVIEHYSTGLANSSNYSELLPENGFQFTTSEKEALIQFLYTLTDEEFLNNKSFGPIE